MVAGFERAATQTFLPVKISLLKIQEKDDFTYLSQDVHGKILLAIFLIAVHQNIAIHWNIGNGV